MATSQSEASETVLAVTPLSFPWQTSDPFLACMYHDDRFPLANEHMGPAASLRGRDIGQDFEGKDGWRMYHGETVPGFPQHPHRGFETVTVVRRGMLDHSDSLGATARFGGGDVQWLTAGKGVLHAEMFPLLDRSAPNPLELFQIWLNLPRASKLAPAYFAMLWNQAIPRLEARDAEGRTTLITVMAGRLEGLQAPPPPPPDSWASRDDNDVAIWTLKMAPGARWTLPAAKPGTGRSLYCFKGQGMRIAGRPVSVQQRIQLRPETPALLENGPQETELLMLQGRPISEPVVQYGPFVMNTRQEIQQTMLEYQRTQFGGWPWKSNDPVHPREAGRFARYTDGRVEKPD